VGVCKCNFKSIKSNKKTKKIVQHTAHHKTEEKKTLNVITPCFALDAAVDGSRWTLLDPSCVVELSRACFGVEMDSLLTGPKIMESLPSFYRMHKCRCDVPGNL
jgi:hypothetical protein